MVRTSDIAVEHRPKPSAAVSAVICTRDRMEQLRRALQSLLDQSVAPAEILVVDNAPSGGITQALVREEFPGVRYVAEPVPGLDFARNRALHEATQPVVAFLDDDAVAAPGWTAAIDAVFRESPNIAICTGKVEALMLETEGQRLFEANGGFARGNRRIHLPWDSRHRLHGLKVPLIAWAISVGSGCSLAVWRRIINDLNGFDEALDMGPALPGGGDLDIIWRALDAGYEVVYEPKVQAWHEHRREVEATIKQILEHNRSLIAVLVKAAGSARASRRISIIAFLLWRLVKPGVRLVRRAVGRDPLPMLALIKMSGYSLRGVFTYPFARRLAARRARDLGPLLGR